ncbi:hypothetical protein [Streptomyces sp. 8K308]|uniref:hypothetical protein n=1 Tax=Streptomyces sp. 8K308 TaxID=2530388 RepID=UPI00140520F6|nr:hypothetical protein [Streptomyces sp. 8K308]
MADRQLGSGHLYNAVTHYLAATMGPKIFGSRAVPGMNETFLAAAALTEMAGWMAHDPGGTTGLSDISSMPCRLPEPDRTARSPLISWPA